MTVQWKRFGNAYILPIDAATGRDPEWKGIEHPMLKSESAHEQLSPHPHDRWAEFDQIVNDAHAGKIGRNVTAMKVRRHFEMHDFDMRDTDPKTGKPRSVEQQLQHHLENHPAYKRAAIAMRAAPLDTLDEQEAEEKRAKGRGLPSNINQHASNAELKIGDDGRPVGKALSAKIEDTLVTCVKKFSKAGENFGTAWDRIHRESDLFRKLVASARLARGL